MNGDDMINEGGPVFDPPLEYEIVGPVDGIRWLLVKQNGRVIYQRTLTDEEQDRVEEGFKEYSWMVHPIEYSEPTSSMRKYRDS